MAVENRRNQGFGPDDAILVKQGQLTLGLKHALDHKHNIRTASVIFVEHQRRRRLQRPRQQAFAKFGYLHAVAQHNGVATDQVDTADMRIEIDADAWPFQPRCNLFDMRRFAGAMIALNHDAPVVGETSQDRERRVRIKHIGGIKIGHALVGLGKGWA